MVEMEGWEVVSVVPSSAAIKAEAASSSAALGSVSMSVGCVSACRSDMAKLSLAYMVASRALLVSLASSVEL